MLAGTQKPMLGMKLNRAHPLADGLVGCWLFNEGVGNKAYDLSGYGNHGTLANMAFPPTVVSGWNPGRRGPAIAFKGSTDYINCGNDSSLNITDAITIEAWVKPTEAKQESICGNFVGAALGGYAIAILASRKLYFIVGSSGGANTIMGNTALSINSFHQIVATHDGTYLNVYLDGKSDKPPVSATHVPFGASSSAVYIGKTPYTYGYFKGMADEVKIYNRTLSAEEVKWLYHEPYAMFERGELLL